MDWEVCYGCDIFLFTEYNLWNVDVGMATIFASSLSYPKPRTVPGHLEQYLLLHAFILLKNETLRPYVTTYSAIEKYLPIYEQIPHLPLSIRRYPV